MKKAAILLAAVMLLTGASAFAEETAVPAEVSEAAEERPSMTPAETAKETGLTDNDWKMLHYWKYNGRRKYRGISVNEKFSFFNSLCGRGYLDIESREYLDGYSGSRDFTKAETWFRLSDNELDNGKTFDDTWIGSTISLYEWNDRVIYDNLISGSTISESDGVYTFDVYEGRIEDAEQGGYEAVTYVKNSNILPDQRVVITLQKDFDNPSGTVSVIEDGAEILRCSIIETDPKSSLSYTYFADKEQGEQAATEFQKQNYGSWTENGKSYRYARISKKPKEIASFHFTADPDGSEIAEKISSDGSVAVDYYVFDPKIDTNSLHKEIEVLVISGDKDKLVFYKRTGFDLSVPTAQSVMLGGDMYVTIPYDRVTAYYDDEENDGEYKMEVCGDENAFLKFSFGSYDKREYTVQLDLEDLHITAGYDGMTSYSENMPDYWLSGAEGRIDSSPEGKRLMNEIENMYPDTGGSYGTRSILKDEVTDGKEEMSVRKITAAKNGDGLEVRIDGEAVNFPDAKPFIDENNRTQIPLRAVAEVMNCAVEWDGENSTVTIVNTNKDTVRLTIGSDVMKVNGSDVQMDTAAVIRNDRTYIPVRFAAEALGLSVEWEE